MLAQRLVICPKLLLPTKIDEVSIKIIQWNISYNSKIEKIIEYLKVHIEGQTIIYLQEVLVSFKEQLIENLQPDAYSYSLDYRKPGLYDGKNRKLGVLTLVFGGQLVESSVLERTVFSR